MQKYLCKCGYCGIQWTDEILSWQARNRKCGKCGETNRIAVKELPREGMDVFGYRFSPPFPEKIVDYNSHEYPQFARYSD